VLVSMVVVGWSLVFKHHVSKKGKVFLLSSCDATTIPPSQLTPP